ncbi:MAG: cupin domain-containing protein [Oscillospiraceae bacterium]|jgi:mannose-6-phosphate isomerase-like protein (cupin superfamily)|nr:cupin domain-containing protein [Oscillospiraceae bacterium]
MTEQLREIGRRLSDLRSIVEIGMADFCEKAGVTAEELAAYERGEKDFSFSFLYNAAHILGVDVMDLMSGDSPRLSSCSLVRDGQGFRVDRRAAYQYAHLAFTFRDKKAEPFLVTVEPKEETPVLHAHEGQEFNYLLSGRMRFYIDALTYVLEPGDSLYFNANLPHAMQALDGGPVRFLAVVMG